MVNFQTEFGIWKKYLLIIKTEVGYTKKCLNLNGNLKIVPQIGLLAIFSCVSSSDGNGNVYFVRERERTLNDELGKERSSARFVAGCEDTCSGVGTSVVLNKYE